MNSLLLSVALFAAALCAGTSSSYASIPPTSKCARLDQFNKIHVGDSIESLPEIAREKLVFQSVRKAQFYFYMLNMDLPKKCLNMECGLFARQVLARGGLLVGGANEAYAKEVGLAPRASLLLVTDPSGKVTAIYRDVSPQDLNEILKVVSN